MWQEGSLIGFRSRDLAEQMLRAPSLPSGTIALRFSEKNPGRFVVSYVRKIGEKAVVGHYLINPDEIANQLPDYLFHHKNIKFCLMQIPPEERRGQDDLSVRHMSKADVLGRFISQKKPNSELQTSERYDKDIYADELAPDSPAS